MDSFAPKFYSPIQNNIGPNFADGLNFVWCEHSLTVESGKMSVFREIEGHSHVDLIRDSSSPVNISRPKTQTEKQQ